MLNSLQALAPENTLWSVSNHREVLQADPFHLQVEGIRTARTRSVNVSFQRTSMVLAREKSESQLSPT